MRSPDDRLPPRVDARACIAYRFAGRSDDPATREALAELAAAEALERAVAVYPNVYAGVFAEPEPTHRLHRGDPMQPREPVAPDVPAVLGSLALAEDASEPTRRLAFARWIASPENPLTARVIANRVWMHHFGEGLVDTPSDFGAMGSEPTHPELLDWLACELIESGWSLKHLQRRILASRTWRGSSRPDEAALAVDADARLLWRFPPRRMEAEYLRDALLALAGTLELEPGGPGFSVFEPNTNYVRVYEPKASFDARDWRRMVYMTKVRMERDATFGVFDTPDAGQVCPERARSTTALQALNLLNSGFVLEQGEHFAARLEREAEGTDARVRRAFALAFAREPDTAELQAGAALAETHGLAAFCRALFNTNELAFVH